MIRTVTLAFAAILAGAALAPLPALAQGTARTSAILAVYSGPGDGYDLITKLKKGEVVGLEYCTRSREWCLVLDENGDEIGWVRAGYLIGAAAIRNAQPFQFLMNPEIVFPKKP